MQPTFTTKNRFTNVSTVILNFYLNFAYLCYWQDFYLCRAITNLMMIISRDPRKTNTKGQNKLKNI